MTISEETSSTYKTAPWRSLQPWSGLISLRDLAIDQWFLVVMGILIAFASQVQVPLDQQEKKRTAVNYLAVSLIFFINGCTIPTQLLLENIRYWRLHLFVQGQCYLLTSLITYGVVSAAATDQHFMDPALLIGIMMLGCLPTAIAFNTTMTQKANGNAALTMVQSMIGNVLGPCVTTGLLNMYTSTGAWYTILLQDKRAPLGETYKYIFKRLGLSLFLPLFAAQILVRFFPDPIHRVFVQWKMNKIASLAFLLIIWDTYDGAFASGAFNSIPRSNMIFLVFILLSIFLLLLAVSLVTSRAWLNRQDTIAVAYLVPTKTPAMGAPLTTIMFLGLSTATQSKMRLPMVIYQALQIAACGLLTIPLHKWESRGRIELTEDSEG